MIRYSLRFAAAVGLAAIVACGGKKAPVPNAPPPVAPNAFPSAGPASASDTPTPRPPEPPPVPPDPVVSTPIGSLNDRSIDEINGPNSPLKPVYFEYDSDTLDELAKKALAANAEVMRTYKTWIITVEGHCDERGSAEYNLALGDRRALAARNYLISLGIPADRLRTVSYGKEFPFDAAHTESAYKVNRRAHFMVTAK
jgi:peptidoglycan-associated lipoprotein